MYFKKKQIKNKVINNFIHSYSVSLNIKIKEHVLINDRKFITNFFKYKKDSKTSYRKLQKLPHIHVSIALVEFFSFFFKRNFYLFFKRNFLNYKFYKALQVGMILQKNKSIYGTSASTIILYFTMLIFYKKPSLFFRGLLDFFRFLSKEEHQSVHTVLKKIELFYPVWFLKQQGILGLKIKFKGQYCRRPGERRQIFYYKFLRFSVSDPTEKYVVAYTQVRNLSGAIGATINLKYE